MANVVSLMGLFVMFGATTGFNLGQNLALKQATLQTSVWGKYDSSRCVDGNLDTNLDHGSCCHTETENGRRPWFSVDLGKNFIVQHVFVTNRDSLGSRMSNFIVGLMANTPLPNNPASGYLTCGQWNGEAPNGVTMVVTCVPWLPDARYVIITTPNDEPMNFCEVQVYGKLSDESDLLKCFFGRC